MARNGYPDDPDYSDSDPTQYADFGGSGGQAYSEYDTGGYNQPPMYDQPPTGSYPPPTGHGQYPAAPAAPIWHQRPAVLIALGALTAALLALLIYAIVSFTNAGSTSTTPAVTSTSGAATTSAAPADNGTPSSQSTVTQTEAPSPSNSPAPPPPPSPTEPSTVTSTVTPTTRAAPTTTEAPSPTTVTSVTTSVTTVTQTTTKPAWPTLFPRPTPRVQEPAPAG